MAQPVETHSQWRTSRLYREQNNEFLYRVFPMFPHGTINQVGWVKWCMESPGFWPSGVQKKKTRVTWMSALSLFVRKKNRKKDRVYKGTISLNDETLVNV